MTKNILHNIEKNMSSFSKGQKLIARFILENYDKAAFMTASKLGKTVQVSESTVVRFATQLGYEGYPSMQRALQEMIRGKLTSIQRIQASDGELAGSDLMTTTSLWSTAARPARSTSSSASPKTMWSSVSASRATVSLRSRPSSLRATAARRSSA